MVYTTNASNIGFKGEYYDAGEIKINDDEKTIEVSQLKKSLFSSKLVNIGKITYSDSTKFSSDGLKIRINDLSFDISDEVTYDQIKKIVTEPYRLERERREKIIKLADNAVINFLLERAKALDDLRELSINPREAIMHKLERVDEGEDPVARFREMVAEPLRQPYSGLDSNLQLLKPIISETAMKRVYAMIFGVASVQTAMLNDSDPAKPLELLEKVNKNKLNWKVDSGSSIADATKSLYSEIAFLNPDALLGKNESAI
jgi:hypothetical protein